MVDTAPRRVDAPPMAETAKPQPAAPAAEAPAKKGGFSMKTAAIVGGIMAAEAAGVFMVARMTSPAPAEGADVHLHGADSPDENATREVPLVDDKLQNMQTGRVWIWDTQIVLKVKAADEPAVKDLLENKKAEVAEGVAMIFRRAQHAHLKEPGLETINRQVAAFVNQMIGKDPEGHNRVLRVVIPRCRGFPGD